LGIDVIQAQGLLKHTATGENHLIAIVESYFRFQREMETDDFVVFLRNAVYSLDKAIELQKTLLTLGENWFALKEELKTIKLNLAPKVSNVKLAKGVVKEKRQQLDPS